MTEHKSPAPEIGKSVLYREDGGQARCTVLAYSNDSKEESATLRIDEVVSQPRIGGEYVVGDEFSVMHRLDVGAWGGDWSIEP